MKNDLLCRGAKKKTDFTQKALKMTLQSKCNIKNDVTKVNAIIQHLVSNKIIKNSSELKIDYLK